MKFLTEYAEDTRTMDTPTQEELFSMIRDFIDIDENQGLVELFLQNMLEQHRGQLQKHNIANPLERNLKNDIDVLERLMNAMSLQSAEQEVTLQNVMKQVAEVEMFKAEHFKMYSQFDSEKRCLKMLTPSAT